MDIALPFGRVLHFSLKRKKPLKRTPPKRKSAWRKKGKGRPKTGQRSPNDFQGPECLEFNTIYFYCWNCLCKPTDERWPFTEPTNLENAHIFGGHGRRKNDRRAVNRLCNLCHRLSHGATVRVRGKDLPKLTLANMLWLKREFDPKYYDPVYLARIAGWAGPESLPDPTEPERWRA